MNYPGLEGSPPHETASRLLPQGFGGILTLELDDRAACDRVMDALELVRRATNVNDSKTLIIHPASTIHTEFTPAEPAAKGVPDGLLRLSVGIEASMTSRRTWIAPWGTPDGSGAPGRTAGVGHETRWIGWTAIPSRWSWRRNRRANCDGNPPAQEVQPAADAVAGDGEQRLERGDGAHEHPADDRQADDEQDRAQAR